MGQKIKHNIGETIKHTHKIYRLKEQSIETQKIIHERIEKMVNDGVLKNPNAIFGTNNVKYDTDYMNKIGSDVIMLPLELMKTYANSFISMCINQGLKPDKFRIPVPKQIDIKKINAMSIGNLALIHEEYSDKNTRKKAKIALDYILKLKLDDIHKEKH